MNLLRNSTSIAFLAVFLLNNQNVYAHAVVTQSSLQIENVAPEHAKQITLNFNSKIELALSQIYLVSAGDVHRQLEATAGDQPGLVIVDLPALKVGEYALRYKIFAADGHLTEDTIHFFVKP
ncbi:MAG: copper resistance CopC family protein [Gammaproteobacteria bacterium]